jgi:class 3 adenylate cyclase
MRSDAPKLVGPTIAAHRGRIVKTTGDGMFVEFFSAVERDVCFAPDERTSSGCLGRSDGQRYPLHRSKR